MRRTIITVAVFLVAGSAGAQRITRFDTKQLPASVRVAVSKPLKDCSQRRIERGFITRPDINGDGTADYVVDFGKLKCEGSRDYCGSGGCLTFVFVSREQRFVQIIGENLRGLRFFKVGSGFALETEHHGTRCDKSGADECSATFLWKKDRFVLSKSSPGFTEGIPFPGIWFRR